MSSTEQTRLEKDFVKFHLKNPDVWTEFKRYTFDSIELGRQHYSAALIIQKIRWDSKINTSKTNAFKIPNATAAYYARLFHKTFPAYQGFFKTFEFGSAVQDVQEDVRNNVNFQEEMAV